jgi:nucleoside-diphosphate-sugar epimerase
MTVVVTGAAGFIGSHLVERLTSTGERVFGIDRRPMVSASGITPVVGDLSTPDANLANILRSADVVYHLAGCPGVRDHSQDIQWRRQRDNVLATQRVLALTPPTTLVVLASSSSVYGGSDGQPCHEDDPPRPRGGYARSKLEAEQLCHARAASGGAVVAARFFTVAGERQRSDMAIAGWINNMINGDPVMVFGDLGRTRDITDVRDVVDAMCGLARVGASGIVNVGTGQAHTLWQVLEAIGATLGLPMTVKVQPTPKDDPDATLADPTRLRQLTGLTPHTDLAALIRRQAASTLPQPVEAVAAVSRSACRHPL